MDCCASIAKYILYIFNLIFVICGILLIILGSLMISNIGDFHNVVESINTNTIPILVIVLGCAIFVVAFFGCCGSIRESICCISIYGVFMFILLVLQLALVVWAFVRRSDFMDTMDKVVVEAWNKNTESNGYPMDVLQIGFKCCGLNSYNDYLRAGNTVPDSCCGSMTQSCSSTVYSTKPGCRGEFMSFWTTNFNIIRYAGIGVALVELVALTFACCLAGQFRKSRRA